MFTLKVFSLDRKLVLEKQFNDETEARLYFHKNYGNKDDFGNTQYFYNLD